MKFSVLASGSSGNSCYIEGQNTRILIDAGLSCRELLKRLSILGIDPSSIDALIITHEHSDHIKGAGPFARKFNVPLLMNRRTFQKSRGQLGNIPVPLFFNTGNSIALGDFELHFFTKCHDAVDPVGIVVSLEGIKLGIATDLGRSTSLVMDKLRGCDALVLEFNHDLEMLDRGPYPLELKKRIRGADGHLSNTQAGDLLLSVLHEGLRYVVLAHLSEINNNKNKALAVARKILNGNGFTRTKILVSEQDFVSPMIDLE